MRARDPLVRVPCLYHFTDVRNIPYIRKRKAILCTARLREKGYTFFAGGNDWSLEQDQRLGMDCYVHLCWTRGHPMEWHIRQRDAEIRIIYLQIDRSILFEPGVLFTPGVANALGMTSHSIPDATKGDMRFRSVVWKYRFTKGSWPPSTEAKSRKGRNSGSQTSVN
jgi:ssDNA thymidine ADP-ribosyltransferase DarT-like protein